MINTNKGLHFLQSFLISLMFFPLIILQKFTHTLKTFSYNNSLYTTLSLHYYYYISLHVYFNSHIFSTKKTIPNFRVELSHFKIIFFSKYIHEMTTSLQN